MGRSDRILKSVSETHTMNCTDCVIHDNPEKTVLQELLLGGLCDKVYVGIA